MERYSEVMGWKNIVKVSRLPKAVYRFNAIRTNSKICMEPQRP